MDRNQEHTLLSSLDLRYTPPANSSIFFIFKKPTPSKKITAPLKTINTAYLAYMSEWCFILLHNYFLKNKNKRRLLGLYPVSKDYFFSHDIFFPSLINIVVFHKSIRLTPTKLTNLRIYPSSSTTISSKVKRSLLLKLRNNNIKKVLFFKTHSNFIKITKLLKLKTRGKNLRRIYRNIKKKFYKFKRTIKSMFFRKKYKKKEYLFRRKGGSFFKKLNFIDFICKPIQIISLNKYSGRVRFRKTLFNNYLLKSSNKDVYTNFYNSLLNLNSSNFFLKKITSLFMLFQVSLLLKFFIFTTQTNCSLLRASIFFNNSTKFFFKNTNLIPDNSFSYKLKKTLVLSRLNFYIKDNIVP
jgi:hypothetical protein